MMRRRGKRRGEKQEQERRKSRGMWEKSKADMSENKLKMPISL